MKNHIFLSVIVSLFISIAGFAAESPFVVKSAKLDQSTRELVLVIEDRAPVSGVCPLNLSRMEYIDGVKALTLHFNPTMPCPQDDYGKRTGTFKWILSLQHMRGTSLMLLVNEMRIATLVIENGTAKTTPIAINHE